ncbi:Co-chaperone protein HscB like protein [Astathelohania contejeani]|uniref:Co-chaperone protein HscB like protein n=1 Tax=Astathelohania contejeani TaxID=164912 RepID=A0ABQ7HXT0_9MICR|nr:Co-chaperone protein HscB like protein [Thelohania contejeani]
MAIPSNYFEIFGLQPVFNIDVSDLKTKYYKISKLLHPDIKKHDDHLHMPLSFETVKKGYETLKNDYTRAKYLNIIEKKNAGTSKTLSNDFLSEILELEDKIIKCDENEKLKDIKRKLEIRIGDCKSNYKNIEYLNKWKYYERLLKLLNKKLKS